MGEKERLGTLDRLLWTSPECCQSDWRTLNNFVFLPHWSHQCFSNESKNRLWAKCAWHSCLLLIIDIVW